MHQSQTRAAIIVTLLVLGLAGSSLAQFTKLGCLLSTSNACNGKGVCERTGICTCNEGYYGENCETEIKATFKKEGVGKGFIAGWTIFWIFLNFALPIVIFIMIKYLNDKNCDTIKEIWKDCLEAFCCCFSKSDDNNFNRIGQDEVNAAVVLRAEQPEPLKAKDNESVAKPGAISSTKTPGSPKSNNTQSANTKPNDKSAGIQGNQEAVPNTPEALFVALLKEDAKDIKWTKKEAAPTKKAIKGLVNLLNNYDFNVQVSFNAVLEAQEKAIKARGFTTSNKMRDELEKEIPLAKTSGIHFKDIYKKKLEALEKEIAANNAEVSDNDLLEFLSKLE